MSGKVETSLHPRNVFAFVRRLITVTVLPEFNNHNAFLASCFGVDHQPRI